MGFTQAELALLEAADRALIKPDNRKRIRRRNTAGPREPGARWKTKPTGRPHTPFTAEQRLAIESMAGTGMRLWRIAQSLKTHPRRILYEYPNLKETNP